MKINIKKLWLCLTFLVILSAGCKKLEEKPTSFVSPQNFFTTVAQGESVLTGCMSNVWKYWENNGYNWGWRMFLDDDQLAGGDLNIEYNRGTPLWIAHYANILNLNTLIRSVKGGSIKGATPDAVNKLTAEAKFQRGWNYFQLVRLFGAVPLYTDGMLDPALNPKARASTEEVYALIIADFQEAASTLPSSWDADHAGRPTSGAAKGLLAKAYLTMATAPLNKVDNYQKAATAAKSAMDDPGGYQLVHNIGDVFKSENKYSKEMMWSFNSNGTYLVAEGNLWAPWGAPGIGCCGWGNFSAERRMDTLWPDQPRKHAYLVTDINGVNYKDWGSQNPTCIKWLPPNISQSDYDNYNQTANLPIIRFADVLMIYAEATNMANGSPNQAACDAVNQVVDRANGYVANVPGHPRFTTAMSKTQFDDAIIMERNWELCFEYDRWFDICRKRILDKVSPSYLLINYSVDDYLYPIPEVDLRLNKLLTQNPGYPSP